MVGKEGKDEEGGNGTFFTCGVQIYGFEEVVHCLRRRRRYLHGEIGGGEVSWWSHCKLLWLIDKSSLNPPSIRIVSLYLHVSLESYCRSVCVLASRRQVASSGNSVPSYYTKSYTILQGLPSRPTIPIILQQVFQYYSTACTHTGAGFTLANVPSHLNPKGGRHAKVPQSKMLRSQNPKHLR